MAASQAAAASSVQAAISTEQTEPDPVAEQLERLAAVIRSRARG